jgi:hypothetical protein
MYHPDSGIVLERFQLHVNREEGIQVKTGGGLLLVTS